MSIATDASAKSFTNAASSLTYSHTCTGSNLYLVVAFFIGGGQTCTGVTYNGVAMTQLETATASNSKKPYMFGLANPATGANNIVISASGSTLIYATSVSYSGCSGTQPDAHSNGTVTNLASISGTVSVVAQNCWTAMYVCSGTDDALGSGSAGSGTTLRIQGDSNGSFYDSNGTVSTGSQSLNVTMTGGNTDDMSQVVISLAPFTDTQQGFIYMSV